MDVCGKDIHKGAEGLGCVRTLSGDRGGVPALVSTMPPIKAEARAGAVISVANIAEAIMDRRGFGIKIFL